MAVTKEQVFAAADQLVAAGQKPTIEAVRQITGGSYTTISPFFREWKAQALTAARPIADPLPPPIEERAVEFLRGLWSEAIEMANARLKAEREALDQVRAEMEAERAEAMEIADRLSAELEALKARLVAAEAEASTAREEARTAEARAQELRAELDRAHQALETAREEAARAREEAAALRGRLEALEALWKGEKGGEAAPSPSGPQGHGEEREMREKDPSPQDHPPRDADRDADPPHPNPLPDMSSPKKATIPQGIFRVPPTEEQIQVIEAALGGQGLSIQAYAGCGKTSTLAMIATAFQRTEGHKRVQYITFNKQLAREAQLSLGGAAECRTMHSLAYRDMIRRYPAIDGLLKTRLSPSFIADHFDVLPYRGREEVSAQAIAYCAVDTVSRYTSSRDDEITLSHVSLPAAFPYFPPDEMDEVRRYILKVAKKVWEEQTKFQNWPISHDTYLKAWALERPYIGADVILFDETQDATPLFIQIIEEQEKRGAQVIWVGDTYQQIYEWRGAVNAIAQVRGERLYLTKSFRFGPEIAKCANEIIVGVFKDRPLIGVGKAREEGRKAILCRTNGDVITEVFGHIAERPAIVGKKDVLAVLEDIASLQQGRPKGQFSVFKTFGELAEYAETEDGRDLRPILRAIDEHGVERLIETIQGLDEDNPKAPLTITTIHRAKGREWDRVDVIADWPVIEDMEDEDWRLLYVAITRARLEVNYEKPKPREPEPMPEMFEEEVPF